MDIGRLRKKYQRHIFSLSRLLLLFYCGVFFLSSIKEKKRSNIINASKATTTNKFLLIIQIKYYQILYTNYVSYKWFSIKNDLQVSIQNFLPFSCLYNHKHRRFVLVYWRRKKMWSCYRTSDIVLCPILSTITPYLSMHMQ